MPALTKDEAKAIEEVKFDIENLPLPILNREARLKLGDMFGGKIKEELLSPFDPEAKKTKMEDMPSMVTGIALSSYKNPFDPETKQTRRGG
jgi:hypothetical protein